MSELSVFLASFLGSFTAVLILVLPVLYFAKKKFENSAIGAMLG